MGTLTTPLNPKTLDIIRRDSIFLPNGSNTSGSQYKCPLIVDMRRTTIPNVLESLAQHRGAVLPLIWAFWFSPTLGVREGAPSLMPSNFFCHRILPTSLFREIRVFVFTLIFQASGHFFFVELLLFFFFGECFPFDCRFPLSFPHSFHSLRMAFTFVAAVRLGAPVVLLDHETVKPFLQWPVPLQELRQLSTNHCCNTRILAARVR